MEALQFGDPQRRLLGLRDSPQVAARQTALVLCPAWGMEALRSHRGVALLARELAAAGYDCLRIDYSGTGDSGGEAMDARLDHWLADIASAVREQQEISGADQIAVVGIRLGALLAAAAKTQHRLPLKALVSWDAPASGAAHNDLMRTLDRASDQLKNARRNRGMRLPPHAPDELCGHAWPAPLAEALQALPGLAAGQPLLCIHSSDTTAAAPDGARTLTVPEAAHWNHVRWNGTPWIPAAGIRQVVAAIREWLP